jgi:AcrR family transcriptional regulator
MSGETASLRGRQRAETRRTIQAHALRLFMAQGYEATPVAEVAAAAGVSPMTVYRHFPTKEDLVLTDEYNRLIADRVAARPADEPLARRIGATLVEAAGIVVGSSDDAPASASPAAGRELLLARLQLMVSTPALRARHWDSQYASQKAIVEALRGDPPDAEWEFRAWAVAGACLAAMNVAFVRWAEEDGCPDLPGLIADALSAAFDGGG